jgi:hypothetical protein
MVKLPWITETGESLTSPPITMVPVRSLTTTLAGERKLMERFCTREIRMGTDVSPLSATLTSIRRLSSAVAIGLAKLLVNRVRNVTCRGKVGVEQAAARRCLKAAQVDGRFPFDDSALRQSCQP